MSDEPLFPASQHVRDLAPSMAASELLQRILTTADKAVVDNEPARGHIHGCAITLAARLEDATAEVERLTGIARDVNEIRREIEACDEIGDNYAGSATAYWTGAEDALLWVLGEGDAPSTVEEDEEEEDGTD